VVLATPAPVTARLLEESVPASAEVVRGLRYNPLGVVHLDAQTDLEGLGFQVAFTEDIPLRGVTFNDSLFDRQDLYTAYLGGARHPDLGSMAKDEMAAMAEREFERCTGFSARAIAVEHERMPAWDVTWRGLHDIQVPERLHLAGNWWSRPGLPGRVAEASEIASRVARSVAAAA